MSFPPQGKATKGDIDSSISTHSALKTGVHGAGANNLATDNEIDTDIATHGALSTGVHGAGANTLATDADIDTDVATHAADLDAHTYNALEKVTTGQYVPSINTRTGLSFTIAANTLYAIPFVVARLTTYDRIAIDCDNAAAGKSVRLGIYNDGTNLYPGSLVLDAGTVSVNAVGVKAATINQQLTKGLYWLVALSDGTPDLVSGLQHGSVIAGMISSDFLNVQVGWDVAQAYGALPATFTGGGAYRTSLANYVPLIVLRASSLD